MWVWMRMGVIALRLVWPYVLRPWRSPLLRWRIETYGVSDAQGSLLHASTLTRADVARFFVMHGRSVARFLRWAAVL